MNSRNSRLNNLEFGESINRTKQREIIMSEYSMFYGLLKLADTNKYWTGKCWETGRKNAVKYEGFQFCKFKYGWSPFGFVGIELIPKD